MGRLLPNRPILRWRVIGILLLSLWGSAFFLVNNYSSETGFIGWNDIWQRFAQTYTHPLSDRQKTLSSRPVREQTLEAIIDVHLPIILQQEDFTINPTSWSITLHQAVRTNDAIGSWTLFGSGIFVTTYEGTGRQQANTILINVQAHYLRSDDTTRWYIDSIQLTQSWSMSEFLHVARAYIKGYEQTRIIQENTPDSVRGWQTFPLFELLAQQTDQHLISSASGSVQLLIDGKERWIDATLDNNNKMSALVRFPPFWLRVQLNQNTQEAYTFSLYHYLISQELLAGEISFVPNRKWLKSTGTWSGSRENKLSYRGSHKFSILPRPLFSIIPPKQSRAWNDIVALRNEEKE